MGAAERERFPTRNQPASPRATFPGRKNRTTHSCVDVMAHLQRLRNPLHVGHAPARDATAFAQDPLGGQGPANWAEYDSYPGFVHPIIGSSRHCGEREKLS